MQWSPSVAAIAFFFDCLPTIYPGRRHRGLRDPDCSRPAAQKAAKEEQCLK
jgi:hypothetical protein